jgi:hypothetical protein
MFDPNPVHHRCRNPHCKAWLKQPAANPRDAFCCARCEVSFYRTHCRVCEKELGETKRNSRRELCGRRQCRNQFRSFRGRFLSAWYPSATGASKPEKRSTKSTSKTTIKSDRGFAIGTDYDREVLRANFRTNAKFWDAAALIGPNDPPVNILGGFKFPNAPKIELWSTKPPAAVPDAGKATILPDDLSIPESIPESLRRSVS